MEIYINYLLFPELWDPNTATTGLIESAKAADLLKNDLSSSILKNIKNEGTLIVHT